MRIAIAWLLLVPLVCLPGRSCGEASQPFRLLPDLDLRVFACSANPGHHLLASAADLAKVLEELARHCRPDDFQEMETAFLTSLESAGIKWQNEALAVVGDWYGTGMATAHLELSMDLPGVLEASIIWHVPPPPLTPDTAVYRGAFAVSTAAVSTIRVHGKGSETTELAVGQRSQAAAPAVM